MYCLKPVFSLTVVAIMSSSFALPAYATYVGNDPVNATDPTGKVLEITGTQKYVDQVNADIIQVQKLGGENAKLINQLIDSKNVHSIMTPTQTSHGISLNHTVGANKTDATTAGVGTNTEIGYDPNNNVTRTGEVRPAVVGLTHELGHVEEFDNGTFTPDSLHNYVPPSGVIPASGITPKNEVNPLKTENRMRRALKLPERGCYTHTCNK